MKTATLKIDSEDKDRLIVISGFLGMPMKDTMHMVLVYLEGIDFEITTDKTMQNVKKKRGKATELLMIEKEIVNAMKDMKNTFISYFKEQEKQILFPMIERMNEMITVMLHYLKDEAIKRCEVDQILTRLSMLGCTNVMGTSGKIIQPLDCKHQLLMARDIFQEFLSHGKAGHFGQNCTFDTKIMDYYKEQLNQLIQQSDEY